MNKLTFLFLALLLSFSLYGQEITDSKQSFLDTYSYLENTESKVDHTTFFEKQITAMGLGEEDEFRMTSSDEGKNGYAHYKFQQYHQGVAVHGTAYLLHEKNGKVVSANGTYFPKVDLDSNPSVTESAALQYAIQEMAAKEYTWEIEQYKGSKKKPSPELVIIDTQLPNFSGNYRLAYKLDLHSSIPLDARRFFIDAQSGKILKQITLHHDNGVPGRGKTKYYGEREFTVDSIGPSNYVLHDPTRCSHGITVYNNAQGTFSSDSSTFDLENEDQDEVALDAHFMTAEFYDRLKSEFDWLGLDNEDGSMNVSIHANGGEDFVNAFWDGEFAWFGDGNCNNGPLVTLEVLAHEFMHGIIDHTSQLIYSDESGAINESLADVMGHYMENEIDPDNFSWTLGNSFALVDGLEPFRVMDDPTAVGNPEYYQGPLWQDGADVHYNSSLGNLVYVALSDGRSGTNLNNKDYTVTGLGRSEAAKFLFFVNRHYLTPSSNYNDYYNACLLASDEYFPGDVDMKNNLIQAWTSVAIPGEVSADEVLALNISSRGFENSCDWGEYGSAMFSVSNVGTLPYLASSDGYVMVEASVSGTDYSERIELTEDILPGENQSFTIDSFMILEDDFFFVDYELYINGSNEGNVNSSDFYFVTEYAEGDLSVRFETGEISCFQDSTEVLISVVNESCEPIQAGEVITLELINSNTGAVTWKEEVTLENTIFSGASVFYNRNLDLGITETTFFDIVVSSDNDPNDSNNTNFAPVTILDVIGVNYYNGFDLDGDLISNGILLETISFGSNIATHDGSNQFFTTGFFDEASGPLCLHPEDNWNTGINFFGNVTAQLNACIDLEGTDKPILYFNMTHFRNDFMDFASSQSASVRMILNQDGNETEQIIAGLPEGMTEEFNIPLPADFKGSLEMKFLTQTGLREALSDYLSYDVVFMDNLAILESVSNDNLSIQNSIQVYPNPVTDDLSFASELELDDVRIVDIYGRTVMVLPTVEDTQTITVGDLEAGSYVLIFSGKKGETVQKKFIKL